MGLSKENYDKIIESGVYKCGVVKEWRPSWCRNEPYHCCNWIFRPQKYEDGSITMKDTYWSTGDGLNVPLTDENFDKFQLLFDMNEVKKCPPPDFYDYNDEDTFHVAMDSGGWSYNKHYYVKKDAVKNKEIQLKRLERELETLNYQLQRKQQEIERVKET